MNSSGFNFFQFLRKSYRTDKLLIHTHTLCLRMETMTITTTLRKTLTPFKVKHLWNQKHPTDNTQQNLLQIPESSYSKKFAGQKQNAYLEMQEQSSDVFSSEQTQTENERLRLQHQRRSEAANQFVGKQEL